ncbi:SAM-dependent methyltransferase [Wenjunlia tyrosinilytica]|uniref:Cyclopropane-fatty-acyl-phospholipid synthase n=1 Tax=Wenjunlia tyrosinilytica TaxID=1544741 RepID=A0A917ZQA5_9ACTN|nr:cyclopropane-fatty-acyl-phospholipid synthase family protein [Wenjunlia tyrosinilytica]GGO88241.1 cyclopropane-fatty-acyl-phospholipid synthase [Wenjunlia tyrosinilytica]
MGDAAGRIAALLTQALDVPPPLRIRAWDGSEAGPPDAPALVIRDRRALRRVLWRPDEVGLARGWVAGEIDVEGDLYEVMARFTRLGDQVDMTAKAPSALRRLSRLRDRHVRRVVREAVSLSGLGPPPKPPREEARSLRGGVHSMRRDRQAISHHYDVGNAFYGMVLGESMVYSCAYFAAPHAPLAEAQRDKLDLVCRKLGLRAGQRLLDVGCGWGSMALHAARTYGVEVVGVTLSGEQATYARKRVAEAGLADRVDIRLQDYRQVKDGPFDAISSVGMAEHVGSAEYRTYAHELHGLLRPGGRLLNHQISRRPVEGPYEVDPFIAAYVFPDGELSPVGTTVSILEDAGFEVRDVQSIREHYALTLRHWVGNLERNWDRAVRLTSPGRARVWRLYMAASAIAFEQNRIGVNQVLAVRTPASGESGLPLTREDWLFGDTLQK